MADFAFNASPAFKLRDPQDDRSDIIDLPRIPESIASSPTTSTCSLFSEHQDEKPLLKPTRKKSWTLPSLPIDGTGLLQRASSFSSASAIRAGREQWKQLHGWRFGVTVAACTSLIVMIFNLILIIVVVAKFGYTSRGGILTAYEGDCKIVDNWSTAIHIIINLLSSMLLGASNYTMQCLCAPTREEINTAHSKGDWLDIGLPSVRNIMGRIAWRRISLWWVLALSSAPIHLLYNSSAFKSIESDLYTALLVNDEFLEGKPFSTNLTANTGYRLPVTQDYSDYHDKFREIQGFFKDNYLNGSAVQNLTNVECISAYGTFFLSGRHDVLVVTSHGSATENDTLFYVGTLGIVNPFNLPYSWMCDAAPFVCDIPKMRANADTWTVNGYKVEYCLSQVATPRCKLQFSTTILAVVTVMNLCKCVSMVWTVFRQKSPTLVILGDAIASFLETPDPLTGARCLTSKAGVSKGPLQWRLSGSKTPVIYPPATHYYATARQRWFTAASTKRWIITMTLCICTLIAASVLFSVGADTMKGLTGGASIASLGFGRTDSRAFISISTSLLGAVLLANLPQSIVSFLYLTYNGLLTSMLLSDEWSRYYLRPKPLRTTTRRGVQRSKYYLHLPYTFSVPLLIASTLLHWLISESIFLARVDYWQGQRYMTSSSQVGYSLLPIVIVISLGSSMVLAALGLGFCKFRSPMPVAGSCSVAISAACQRPEDDMDAAYHPVSWGEVDVDESSDEGHRCCFTSFQTKELVPGRLYGGHKHDVHTETLYEKEV